MDSVVRQTEKEKQVEITGEIEFWRISQKSQVWNLNNTTGYPWEKKYSRKCFEAHQFMVQTH